jgi:lysophospholipase L1-like esterase
MTLPKKLLILFLLWLLPGVLLYIFIFSVYPNYILAGHHNQLFIKLKHNADILTSTMTGQNKKNKNEISLNMSKIELSSTFGTPPIIPHPFIEEQLPEKLPETAYFTKQTKPVLYHPAMIPDPFTTYAPLPGRIEGYVYHNRQQFRYPVDLDKKKKNELRIFITGASAAWGCNATDTAATIAGYMEAELRKRHPGRDIKVITAAAGAWTSTQERIWIFNRITEYEPDMIIQYSGVNDIFFGGPPNKEDLYNRYYSDGKYYQHAIAGYEYYNRGETISSLVLKDHGDTWKPTDFPRKTLKNITITNLYLKKAKIPYVYVFQAFRKNEREKLVQYFDVLGHGLSVLAREEGFSFIDDSRILDQTPGMFTDATHLGDRGNQFIAFDLLSKIDLESLIRKTETVTH